MLKNTPPKALDTETMPWYILKYTNYIWILCIKTKSERPPAKRPLIRLP